MKGNGKQLVWLSTEVKSPPLSGAARRLADYLLRLLQSGIPVTMPHSRPMPGIGGNCHELRVPDGDVTWRIIYGIEPDAIAVLLIFAKKTRTTPDEKSYAPPGNG